MIEFIDNNFEKFQFENSQSRNYRTDHLLSIRNQMKFHLADNQKQIVSTIVILSIKKNRDFFIECQTGKFYINKMGAQLRAPHNDPLKPLDTIVLWWSKGVLN